MNIEILMKQFNNMSSDSRMKFAERLTKEYPSVADDLSFKLDAAYQDAVVESENEYYDKEAKKELEYADGYGVFSEFASEGLRKPYPGEYDYTYFVDYDKEGSNK